MVEFMKREELAGTMVIAGATLTNSMRAYDLNKMTLVFWQALTTNYEVLIRNIWTTTKEYLDYIG